MLLYQTAERIGPPVASRLQLDNHGLLISNGHLKLGMGVRFSVEPALLFVSYVSTLQLAALFSNVL